MSALISWEAPRGADVLQRTLRKELMWTPALKSPLRVRYNPPLLSGTGERVAFESQEIKDIIDRLTLWLVLVQDEILVRV